MMYLVDADIVAFKAAAAVERPVQWDDDLWTLHAYESEGIDYCTQYFDRILAKLGDADFQLFLTDKENWRRDVLPSYKAHRSNTRKPLILSALKQHMLEHWSAVMVPTLEADDLLGITATTDADCIIVSEDKDLLTIPTKVFNPAKDEEPRQLSAFQAFYNHMFQTLVGDRTDGYEGCPSIGPVKAHRVLQDATTEAELWAAVVDAYKKNKLSEAAALQQAQVARICHASDFNFDTGKVTLWNPTMLTQ